GGGWTAVSGVAKLLGNRANADTAGADGKVTVMRSADEQGDAAEGVRGRVGGPAPGRLHRRRRHEPDGPRDGPGGRLDGGVRGGDQWWLELAEKYGMEADGDDDAPRASDDVLRALDDARNILFRLLADKAAVPEEGGQGEAGQERPAE